MENLTDKHPSLEKQYRVLIENAKVPIYIADAQGRFVFLNKAIINLFGYLKEEMLNLKVADLFVDSNVQKQLDIQLLQYGSVNEFESLLEKKNGDEVLCLLTIFTTQNDSMKIIGYQGNVYDITPNKRATDKLKATKEYTKSIIDSSMDMIIASDQDRRIVEFNRAAQQTFGYRLSEVLGAPVSILYNDDYEGQTVHEKTLYTGPQIQEVLCRRKNGESFPAFLSSSVLRNDRGVAVGVMQRVRLPLPEGWDTSMLPPFHN